LKFPSDELATVFSSQFEKIKYFDIMFPKLWVELLHSMIKNIEIPPYKLIVIDENSGRLDFNIKIIVKKLEAIKKFVKKLKIIQLDNSLFGSISFSDGIGNSNAGGFYLSKNIKKLWDSPGNKTTVIKRLILKVRNQVLASIKIGIDLNFVSNNTIKLGSLLGNFDANLTIHYKTKNDGIDIKITGDDYYNVNSLTRVARASSVGNSTFKVNVNLNREQIENLTGIEIR